MTPGIPQPACNLLLEGGITSGIVYPALITTLGHTYRFRKVGGTSAGAIGAAFAAAAEYARAGSQATPNEGFSVIDRLAADLRKPVSEVQNAPLLLQALFQPTSQTRPVFDLLTAAAGKQRLVHTPVKALEQQPLAGLLGALPGLGVAAVSRMTERPLVQLAGLALGGALGAAGAVTAALAVSLVRGQQALERTTYGLCPGRTAPGSFSTGLTDWLHEAINQVAGLDPERSSPLTFGDLEERGVTLRTITTCLTLGRPFALPFDNRLFYFNAEEMKAWFPDPVVQHLVTHCRPPQDDAERELHLELAEKDIYPLPLGNQLPVVFGVRLSLSFPLLISAVQLYAFDYRRSDASEQPTPVLFTDGGLSSNLPLHFFDTALPECPTFAVNLRSLPGDKPLDEAEAGNVWLPGKAQGRLPEFRAVKGVGAFGMALFDTARNWKDGIYITAPGYRDRIVHVYLDGQVEGGLNLGMDEATVTRLVERGKAAAQVLIAEYSSADTWDRHRRVRLVTLLSAVAELADEYGTEFNSTYPGTSWADILGSDHLGYAFSSTEKANYTAISNELVAIGNLSSGMQHRPRPIQRLRLTLDP